MCHCGTVNEGILANVKKMCYAILYWPVWLSKLVAHSYTKFHLQQMHLLRVGLVRIGLNKINWLRWVCFTKVPQHRDLCSEYLNCQDEKFKVLTLYTVALKDAHWSNVVRLAQWFECFCEMSYTSLFNVIHVTEFGTNQKAICDFY